MYGFTHVFQRQRKNKTRANRKNKPENRKKQTNKKTLFFCFVRFFLLFLVILPVSFFLWICVWLWFCFCFFHFFAKINWTVSVPVGFIKLPWLNKCVWNGNIQRQYHGYDIGYKSWDMWWEYMYTKYNNICIYIYIMIYIYIL